MAENANQWWSGEARFAKLCVGILAQSNSHRDDEPSSPRDLASQGFRLLVESVEDYAIFMLDVTGRVLTWNRGAERIKGYSASEIIGRHFSTFYPAEDIASHKPEDELRVAIRDGRVEDEGWRVRKDGTRFWANVVITALHDETGKLLGFGKVTRDLSERRAAAEELRRSEQQLRLLIEGVGDYALYMLDPSGKVSTWNSGARAIKGYEPSEIIGRSYSAFFTEEAVQAGRPEAELNAARTVGRYEEEGIRVRKDGTRFWANVILTALRDARGELVGFAKVTRDLTDQKRAEHTAHELMREQAARNAAQAAEHHLREERERYKALSRRLEVILEGIADGITVQDRSGALIFANTAAARLFGFESVAELLRAPPAEILARFEMFDEQGRPFDASHLPALRVLQGEETTSAALRVKDRGSGRQWWLVIRASPVRGETGETELAVNVWHDVSADRRREEYERYIASATATLASSLDYQSMLRSLAGVLVPGLADWCSIHLLNDGKLENAATAHVDPARVYQARDYGAKYPPDPSGNRGVWGVIRSGNSELYPEITDEMLQEVARDTEHLETLRRVGTKSIIIVPIRIRERIVGSISLISAESGRRYDQPDLALVEELGRRAGTAIENALLLADAQAAAMAAAQAARVAEEASRVKDEFLATVSHELRTPLNAIVGWSALLRTQNTDPSATKGLDVIHRNAQAQGKLIEDILDVSRIITGKLRLDLKPVDIGAVVRDAIDVVRPSVDAKRIALTLTQPEVPSVLTADPERLQQVVWNLLSNAVKFTDDEGSIDVVIELQGSNVVVTVADTGRGIDAGFLPYAFDRFKQADGSTTRHIGGLGLGLAIVRHIVELHGGHVTVRSDGLGKGATFAIQLPVRAALPALLEPVPGAEPAGTHDGKSPAAGLLDGLRVLIVDDEPDALDLLRAVLGRAGAAVETAASAAAAYELLQQFRPDVLVSDIGMPDEDGYGLMRRIRALDPALGGGIPSVALTAYTRGEDKTKALAVGFTTHISKPVNPNDLVVAVANLAHLAARPASS